MTRILAALAIIFVCAPPAGAQVTPADSAYYDFWVGEWHQVMDGQVAGEPRFVVAKGLYPGALEEDWQMEGYRAKGWRAWDASRNTWTFVWISERGHFQVWDERKVGDEWYMYKVFVIEGEEVLSRQAFLPQEDGSVLRISEHSRDGGATWALRFEERYVRSGPDMPSPAGAREDGVRQLTHAPFSSRAPSWNPAGSHIAFESDRSGNWDLYVLEVGSGSITRVTTSDATDRHPSWSPDGRRLVFVSDRDGAPDLYVVRPSSGEVRRLASIPGDELFPAWSPDGVEVAFSRRLGESYEILSIRVGDSIPRSILPSAGRDLWPRWSPGGMRIAFFSRRDTNGVDDEVHVVDLPSGVMTRLTTRSGHDFCPAWSPTGDELGSARGAA